MCSGAPWVKKIWSRWPQQREKFRQGAMENGIDEEISMRIFDKMEKFAAYGFNKSHAAAYGYFSYVTAYLKANYPKEWMAALMTCDSDDLSKVAKFIRECQAMDIAILPPDINEAGADFRCNAPKAFVLRCQASKALAQELSKRLFKSGTRGGPFKSLYEFFKRIDTKRVGKKVIENLVDAGCFDFTGWSRDALRESIDPIFSAVAKEQADASKGFLSLFALIEDTNEGYFSKPPEIKRKSTKQEILFKEKTLLGFFLGGHPLDEFKHVLKRISCVPLIELERMEHDAVCRVGFLVESIQVRVSAKSQKKFAILVISDGIENYELPIWPELYEEKAALLQENRVLFAVLQVDKKEETMHLTCKWLSDLTQISEEMAEECDQAYDKAKHQAVKFAAMKNKQGNSEKSQMNGDKTSTPVAAKSPAAQPFSLKLNADIVRHSHILRIKQLFAEYRGATAITIEFEGAGQPIASLQIDSRWGITYHPDLEKHLRELPSVLTFQR